MTIKRVENHEDLRDYLADKALYGALIAKKEISETHSYPKLLRMWVENEGVKK